MPQASRGPSRPHRFTARPPPCGPPLPRMPALSQKGRHISRTDASGGLWARSRNCDPGPVTPRPGKAARPCPSHPGAPQVACRSVRPLALLAWWCPGPWRVETLTVQDSPWRRRPQRLPAGTQTGLRAPFPPAGEERGTGRRHVPCRLSPPAGPQATGPGSTSQTWAPTETACLHEPRLCPCLTGTLAGPGAVNGRTDPQGRKLCVSAKGSLPSRP